MITTHAVLVAPNRWRAVIKAPGANYTVKPRYRSASEAVHIAERMVSENADDALALLREASKERRVTTLKFPTPQEALKLLDVLRDRAYHFEEIAPPPEGDTRPVYDQQVIDGDMAAAYEFIERVAFCPRSPV